MAGARDDEENTPDVHGDWLAMSGAAFAMVNLYFPLRVVDSDGNETPYFGLAHWVLPRVPTLGEEVAALNHRVRIDGVLWTKEARVSVRLAEIPVPVDALSALEEEGWSVYLRDEREPPSEWFESVE